MFNSHNRLLSTGLDIKTFDAQRELLASLDRIFLFRPPVLDGKVPWILEGLYNGPVAISYLFLRISQIYPDLKLRGHPLLTWSKTYFEIAVKAFQPTIPAEDGFLRQTCGIANHALAHRAVRLCFTKVPSLVGSMLVHPQIVERGSAPPPIQDDDWL